MLNIFIFDISKFGKSDDSNLLPIELDDNQCLVFPRTLVKSGWKCSARYMYDTHLINWETPAPVQPSGQSRSLMNQRDLRRLLKLVIPRSYLFGRNIAQHNRNRLSTTTNPNLTCSCPWKPKPAPKIHTTIKMSPNFIPIRPRAIIYLFEVSVNVWCVSPALSTLLEKTSKSEKDLYCPLLKFPLCPASHPR